jgi:hypothetical protein
LTLPGPRTIDFFKLPKRRLKNETDEDWEKWGPMWSSHYDENKKRCQPLITNPAFLHVDHESRVYCSTIYTPCFEEYTYNKSAVYINFSQDTIMFPRIHDLYYFFSGSPKTTVGMSYIRKIQHIANPWPWHFEQNPMGLVHFHSLKTITIKRADQWLHHNSAEKFAKRSDFEEKWLRAARIAKDHGRAGIVHEKLEFVVLDEEDFKERLNCDGRSKWT